VITNPVNFQKIRPVFTNPTNPYKSFSTMARNESLKIEICKSESLRILKLPIRESGFANPNPKDLYHGFVLEKKNSQITRFVSFRKDLYTNPASLVFCNWMR